MWESFISFQNERLKKSKSPSLGGWGCCKSSSLLAPYSLLLLHHFGHTQTIFVFCQLILCWIVKNTLFSTASAIIIIIISYCTVWNFFFFICFSACISVSVLLCSVKCKLCSVENVVGLGVFIIFDMFRFFPFLFEGWMRLKLV